MKSSISALLPPAQNARSCRTTAFTPLYRPACHQQGKDDPNVRRLRAVVRIFGLSPSKVAKAAGVSPAYVSRLLSDSDPFLGSPEFYRRLETKLGSLIDGRHQQFFRVPPISPRSVERAVDEAGR